VIERLEALLGDGDRVGVLTTFLTEIVLMPPTEQEMLRSLPNWPARVAAAHTIPRELRADESYLFEPARFSSQKTPTLLLLGGASPLFFAAAIDLIHAALSESQVVTLAGQQHTAINTAPELFAREVIAFAQA
jgi:pimeloyl-ACP methyl ester carboxylesterase